MAFGVRLQRGMGYLFTSAEFWHHVAPDSASPSISLSEPSSGLHLDDLDGAKVKTSTGPLGTRLFSMYSLTIDPSTCTPIIQSQR